MVWNVQRSAPVRDVVGADVAGRCRQPLADPSADDDQVLVDDARRGEQDRLRRRIAAEVLRARSIAAVAGRTTAIGFPVRASSAYMNGPCPREDPRFVAARPVGDAAVRPAPLDARIELPAQGAGRGVERDDLVLRRRREQDAVDDDRVRLEAAGLARIVRPRDLEGPHVRPVDLREGRVANLLGSAAVRGPSHLGALGARRRATNHERGRPRPPRHSRCCALLRRGVPRPCASPFPWRDRTRPRWRGIPRM